VRRLPIEAAQALLPLAYSDGSGTDPAIIALMITVAVLRPEESRGAHFRIDSSAVACRSATPRDAWPRGTGDDVVHEEVGRA
jgi:aspartate oxidase